jgi:plastocyanin
MIQDRSTGTRIRVALTIVAAGLIAAMLTRPVSAQSQMHHIKMNDMAFAPVEVTVRNGETVEWNNRDPVAHTATSKKGAFDITVPPGQKRDRVMTQPGTFTYLCRYHPNMRGRIVVKP